MPMGMGHMVIEGLKCPEAAGTFNLSSKNLIDTSINGVVEIDLTAVDANNKQIACVTLSVDVEDKLEEEVDMFAEIEGDQCVEYFALKQDHCGQVCLDKHMEVTQL